MNAREALAALKWFHWTASFPPGHTTLRESLTLYSAEDIAAAIEAELPTEAEKRFFEAAKVYCAEWEKDLRNVRDHNEAQRKLNNVREAVFQAYRALLSERAAKEAV